MASGRYRGMAAEDRRAERRERLLEAGLDALGTRGFEATTVRGVCEGAGLNPRYFYESFDDLDALFVAVFDRIAAESVECVVSALASAPDDAHGRAHAVIEAFVSLMTDDPRKGRVAFIEAMGSETLMRRRLDTLQAFTELVAEEARAFYGAGTLEGDGTVALTAQMLVGGLTETLIAWLGGRLDVSREQLVDHAAALFVAAARVTVD